jgi:DNA topoisomerase-1
MNLMIVESPNKIKKIKAILGSGWDVAASVGHIRDLPVSEFGIEPETYRLQYQILERSKAVVSQLRQRVARSEQVYLATDPDREGEAIAWHLQQVLKPRRHVRVTFDAITESVIRSALKAPRQLNTNLIHAQEARRGADRLVGYQVSPALSQQTGIARLSAGRVQSVALRLVVDRQREIDAFRETKHFGAEAIFDNGKWRAQWDTAPFLKEGEEYILDASLAEEAAKCRLFAVTAAATKPAAKAPPPPFTTATLLQAASVTLGYKPEQTAQLAQRLFEEGLITYHRTDSQNFSAEALAEIRAYAASNNLPLPPKPRTWKSKESAQEAHEAIRPTHLDQRHAGADNYQKNLYDLIWTRAVASQLADAEYSVNTLTLAAQDGSQPFVFKAMGRTLIKPGWRALTAKDAAEEPDANDTEDPDRQSDENGRVPSLGRGTQLRADSARVLNKQTRPPNGYTQASLIKKLEHEGIGRPSTYPAILKNIITRNYIDDSKKILRATDLGILLIDALKGHFAFLEYDYTRSLEQQLDDIAEGKAQYINVVSGIDGQLKKELAQLHIAPQPALASALASNGSARAKTGNAPPSGSLMCPKCKQGVVKKPNGQKFYGCSRYREGCNFSVNETVAKKTLTPKQVEMLCTKGKTALLKGFISKQGKRFEAFLTLGEETDWKAQFRFGSGD